LTIANNNSDKLYIPVDQLVDEYTEGSYITITDREIAVDINSLESYFNGKYDAKNAAATVQGELDAFKTSTDETFKAYTKTSDLNTYIGTTFATKPEVASSISTALTDYIKTNDVEAKVTALGYAKKSDISSALESYTKTSDLNTYIGTTLGYATKTEVASSINTTLTDYIKTNDVEAKVTALGYAKAADVESTYVKQSELNSLSTKDIDDIINGVTE
jgi:DNA recombination-dependent growth factor C